VSGSKVKKKRGIGLKVVSVEGLKVKGHKLEVEGQRSKVKGQRSKVKGQKSKVKGQKKEGYWIEGC
jgi:hypothetical protein